jgi:hypothetical protein
MPPKSNKQKGEVSLPQYDSDEQITNFYQRPEVQKYQKVYHNPNYDENTMPLKHPLRMAVIGSSGSGKTLTLINIMHKMNNTFENIYLFTANSDEPLYDFLKENPMVQVFEGLNELYEIPFDELEGQTLVIFDDLVLEKNQKGIEELFIRGRKMAGGSGVSIIYLSQVYFKIPRTIRLNCTSFILKKIGSDRDIKALVQDKSLGKLTAKEVLGMYDYCISKGELKNFLYIDLNIGATNMFRRKFSEILKIDDFKIHPLKKGDTKY